MGNKFYFKSLSRLIKSRPLYALFLLVIVIFSVVFTSYIYRIGMGFAYDGAAEPPFSYSFSTQKSVAEIKNDTGEIFKKYGLIDFNICEHHPEGYTLKCKDNEWVVDYSENMGLVGKMGEEAIEYDNLSDYITLEDIQQERKYVVINKLQMSDKILEKFEFLSDIQVGEEIFIRGVAYTIKGIDEFSKEIGEDKGWFLLDLFSYVTSEELLNSYEQRSIDIETEKQISNFKIKSIAKANGMEFTGTEVPLVILAALTIAAAISVLFVLNAAILFRYLIKSQEKLYVMYKMLGAKTHQLLVTMVLQTLPICALGVAIGIGIDFLVAPITPFMEGTVTTLNGMGIFWIVVLNMVGMLIGLILAGIKSARALPCDGEKGVV